MSLTRENRPAWCGFVHAKLCMRQGCNPPNGICTATVPGLTDEDILKLVCGHTGKRVSLSIEDCRQYIDVVRAAIAAHTLKADK